MRHKKQVLPGELRKILRRKVWKFEVLTWLVVIALLCALAGLIGFFFFRREVVQYRVGHTFGVRDPAFFGSAHALGDPLPIPGNKIEVLQNGDQIFPAMLEAIRGAKKSVNFEAYIFSSGKVGSQFMEAFRERAKAGVTVRILLDGIGSSNNLNNSDVKEMENAGCHVAYFHPTLSARIDRANRRTHRRIMVVDGRVGFTGSVAFSDEWLGNADAPDHWRDLHLKIQGPLVAKLQGAFQQHWALEKHEAISGEGDFPPLEPAGNLKCQMTASHDFSIAPLALVQAVSLAAAEKTIYITNPYCTPSKAQEDAMIEAARRGVDVRLLLPGKHNDQPATKAAGRTSYGKLLEGGVKIYEYEPTMIHSKTMVVDGMFELVGTSNLDARSSEINEELDISVYDEGFGKEMTDIFLNDLKHSRRYNLDEFEKRGLWERFCEWIMIPFRSQL